mgnify:CR=1 FL=1
MEYIAFEHNATAAELVRKTYDTPPLAFVHSYGCQQNVNDGERIKGVLVDIGYGLCDKPEDADLILFNTCAVREHAEQRVFGNVGALKGLKEKKPGLMIGLCGCMANQKHVVEKLRQSYPYVDLVFGVDGIDTLPQLIAQKLQKHKRVLLEPAQRPVIVENIPIRRESEFRAWLPIMYGISTLTGDDPDKIAELDIYDEELWKTCNPNYGVIVQPRKFREDARAAKMDEGKERTFRWLRLNQWISTKDVGWLSVTLYDKTQIGPSAKAERETWVREHLAGKTCYGGLDLSATTDLTAFVLLFPPQEGLDTWVMLPVAWRPLADVLAAEQKDHVPYRDWERAGFLNLCPGDMIDYAQVEQTIYEAAESFDLRCLGVDPFLSRTLISRLASPTNDAGEPKPAVRCIDIPQGIMHMSPPTKELERLIRSHKMLHVHNTCARWCFGNARCYVDGNENRKLMKDRSIGRIDIIVAWVIALATATVMRGQNDFDTTKLGEDWGL